MRFSKVETRARKSRSLARWIRNPGTKRSSSSAGSLQELKQESKGPPLRRGNGAQEAQRSRAASKGGGHKKAQKAQKKEQANLFVPLVPFCGLPLCLRLCRAVLLVLRSCF